MQCNFSGKCLCAAAWMTCLTCLTVALGCNRNADPFKYVHVQGKVTYEDGQPLPTGIFVTFYPIGGSLDQKTHPRPGRTTLEKETGAIGVVSSNHYDDGLVPGRYKVTLTGVNNMPLPPNVAAPEYSDLSKTPLEVDTTKQPFELKVKKPK
jgi:hypothetical protein